MSTVILKTPSATQSVAYLCSLKKFKCTIVKQYTVPASSESLY